MKKLFGTDGVRGEANVVVTPLLSYEIGAALAMVLQQSIEKPTILVGRDTRLSGSMIAGSLMSGVCAFGGEVVSLGIVPTPAVSALVRERKAAAGIVISASHNPYYDNGIKIFGADGRKLPDEIEEKIEEIVLAKAFPALKTGKDIGHIVYDKFAGTEYVSRLKKFFPMDLSRFKLVVDCANGATSNFAAEMLRSMGADIVAINKDYDGININENCGSTKPASMKDTVWKEVADMGIAYDGDGDRVILADGVGNIVDGDIIMAIIAAYLKKNNKLANNRLVATVMSNLGLKIAMEKLDIDMSQTVVGDKYVITEMDKTGAVIGGEQSGHIILSQYNPTGDGMLTSLMILKIMLETGDSLAELSKIMKPLPQILKNVTVAKRDQWATNPKITAVVKKAETILGDNGRILIRPSGTEPLLRVMGEGPDVEELEKIIDELVEVISIELK
ncbi:MAG: phosphoglucosamine mutase [Clostridiales bacterium]